MQTSKATTLIAGVSRRLETQSVGVLVPVRVVIREAVVAGIIAAGLTVLFIPRELTDAGPHPAWVAVLILAARYGNRGLAFVLPSVWGTVALVSLADGTGTPFGSELNISGTDLATLAVCILVAWVASVHERRSTGLAQKIADLEKSWARDRDTLVQLRTAAVVLRGRTDLVEHSLSFLRDVAGRLEGNNAIEGAQAALDLALARTGARSGMVQLAERGLLRTLVRTGAWSLYVPTPPDLLHDRTAYAALKSNALARGEDCEETGPDDSDLAAAIVDDAGNTIGVLALRGVPSNAGIAAAHDLALIGSWCGKAIAASCAKRFVSATPEHADDVQISSTDDTAKAPTQWRV